MTFKSHITIVHTKLLTEVKYSGNEVKSLRGSKHLHHQNLCLQPICSDTGTRVGMFDFWIRLHPLFDRMGSSRVECMLPKSGSFHEYLFQFPWICKINCRENYFWLTQKKETRYIDNHIPWLCSFFCRKSRLSRGLLHVIVGNNVNIEWTLWFSSLPLSCEIFFRRYLKSNIWVGLNQKSRISRIKFLRALKDNLTCLVLQSNGIVSIIYKSRLDFCHM